MPVEDILKVMTLEQAQEVVVDSGVCRGLTIAEAVSYTHLDVYKRQVEQFAKRFCIDRQALIW